MGGVSKRDTSQPAASPSFLFVQPRSSQVCQTRARGGIGGAVSGNGAISSSSGRVAHGSLHIRGQTLVGANGVALTLFNLAE